MFFVSFLMKIRKILSDKRKPVCEPQLYVPPPLRGETNSRAKIPESEVYFFISTWACVFNSKNHYRQEIDEKACDNMDMMPSLTH